MAYKKSRGKVMEKNKSLDNDGFISKKETEVKKVENKASKNKNKKPNFFTKMGAKIKDVFSELKKVSWPTFGKVVKETGIVVVVVLAFLIVLTAFDFGLQSLLKLLK